MSDVVNEPGHGSDIGEERNWRNDRVFSLPRQHYDYYKAHAAKRRMTVRGLLYHVLDVIALDDLMKAVVDE